MRESSSEYAGAESSITKKYYRTDISFINCIMDQEASPISRCDLLGMLLIAPGWSSRIPSETEIKEVSLAFIIENNRLGQ